MQERAPLVLATLLGVLVSCGYHTSLSLPAPYNSLGIELFSNSSPEPDLEAEFHVALVQSARELLEVPLVSPERAPVVLRGEVIEYRRRSGIRSKDNVQLETGLTIRAQASLVDAISGEPISGPITVSTQVGFTLDRRTVNEAAARQRAVENLAQRIILELSATARAPKTSAPSDEEDEGTFEDREAEPPEAGASAPGGA